MNSFTVRKTVCFEPIAEQARPGPTTPALRPDALQETRERRREPGGATAAQVDEGLLHRGREQLGLLVGIGGEDIETEHHAGLAEPGIRAERAR